MKTQFIPLLKYELARLMWFIPLIYGLLTLEIYHKEIDRTKYMFRLDTGGLGTTIIMLLWFAFYSLFLINSRPIPGQRSGTMAGWGVLGLDFFFSRAINRRSWFVIKTALFALIALIPTFIFCLSDAKSTSVRIELPYNSLSSRTTMTAFYRGNFDGAYLEKPDTGQNEDYVVLPNGKNDMAHFQIVSNILALILFQLLAFLFWPRGWGLLAAFAGSFASVIFLSFSSAHMPSRYEEGVAFVAQYPVTTVAALAAFYLICQLYCGWRFIRTEFAL